MNWKDTLLSGGSRIPIPYTGQAIPAGWTLDDFHKVLEASGAGPVLRSDWVAGAGGRPVISGSSESQVGSGAPAPVPSPGFEPVDPGTYGGQVFAGRNAAPQVSDLAQIVSRIVADARAAQTGIRMPAPSPEGSVAPAGNFAGVDRNNIDDFIEFIRRQRKLQSPVPFLRPRFA